MFYFLTVFYLLHLGRSIYCREDLYSLFYLLNYRILHKFNNAKIPLYIVWITRHYNIKSIILFIKSNKYNKNGLIALNNLDYLKCNQKEQLSSWNSLVSFLNSFILCRSRIATWFSGIVLRLSRIALWLSKIVLWLSKKVLWLSKKVLWLSKKVLWLSKKV